MFGVVGVKIALISDIHANREALDAVLAHLGGQGVDRVYCLGDVVGYGPDPEYCVDVIRSQCAITLMGNHDEGLFHGAKGFNDHARAALEFTRKRMRPRWFSARIVKQRWEWLRTLPQRHQEGRFLFVHGSPRDPVREYVLSTDGFLNPTKLRAIFDAFEGIAFAGHTHHPGTIDGDLRFHGLDGSESFRFDFQPGGQYFVNVGSVGQPRDGDSRACYAILDEQGVTWHRVPYDIPTTQMKIRQQTDLHEILASRLSMGR
ncbi:MAG: metallophosphoesterase family protein [Planctomycetes bacterium]|nr:metallophosphoesterase family protein [Planctomycetota bacterium]